MTEPNFLIVKTAEVSAKEWLEFWANRYTSDDEAVYLELLSRSGHLSYADFELIGRWKDGALGESQRGRWKENVASVAYLGWMKAANDSPRCPPESGVQQFLEEWSEWKYPDSSSRSADKQKRFGLSRASTLLHFISGGAYPILDSRVQTAIGRLRGDPPPMTIDAYVMDVSPFVTGLLALCGCQDIRKMDRALFSYGAWTEFQGSVPE